MRKTKEELIEIWLDTESRFKDYPNKITGYNNVVFAIINDRNSVASNYEIFNQVLG